ncbi:MAG: epoxyqueuosine reductase QueH [Christensenellaceae bacterium]|jgi:predicted adenine nucleotide alpha hydrolase (AANH) superfamily ATPase|nr:epoxyqueuosine reductase QueH [Christensenellaceae bacterium]
MKLLLHICCAPCSVKCIEYFRKEKIDITGFWYNPNIHPLTEYTKRLETLIEYAKRIELPLEVIDYYGLRTFVKNVADDVGARCSYCYKSRLNMTAEYARNNQFDAFSTTLTISPYQKHDLIREHGDEIGESYEIKFLYKDFRESFRTGQALARENNLYMQKYCGCIFSEEERYSKSAGGFKKTLK